MIKNNKDKYFETAEIGHLRRSLRILEIIIEEYSYKHLKYNSYSIRIPKGRFELEGIFLDDIEFCLKKFVNQNEKGSLILRLENKIFLKNYINLRRDYKAEVYNETTLKSRIELDQLEFSENFVFSTFKDFSYQKLIDIHNNLLSDIENRKIFIARDISNFLYFQDRVLFVHNLFSHVAIQIDLSKKGKRSPDKMYYFISSFIQLVRETGKISDIGVEANILQSQLLLQIQKDHNISFSLDELSYAKKNFLDTKIGEKLKDRFIISNYQKYSESYNFKLLLN